MMEAKDKHIYEAIHCTCLFCRSQLSDINKMFLFCYDDVFNLIPVSLSCFIVIPAFLDQIGNKYSLLSIIAAFLFSKLISFSNEEVQPSLVACWLGLLSQTSRLALACSGLGQLLTDYHGKEDATYHLFPGIPWLMPVTITFILAAMVGLGLQPSNFLKLAFYINCLSLVSIFLLIGAYTLISIDKELVLSLKLDKIDELPSGIIFFLQSFVIQMNGKRYNNSISSPAFILLLLVIVSLSTFNERVNCDRIISCMKTVRSWWEPVTLAMTISSLGLCLPDLFVAAQEFLHKTQQLRKILNISKSKFNSTITIGLICAGLVYFCSLSSLIMILGSSLVMQSTIEKLKLLLNISNDENLNNELNEYSTNEDSDLEDLIKTSDDLNNRESDTDSSFSDISVIVAEYKAQVKIMNADVDANKNTIVRMIYLSHSLLGLITTLGLLLAYLVQSKRLIAATFTAFGLIFFIIVYQWVVRRVRSSENLNAENGLRIMCSYVVSIIVLIGISKAVWFYLIIWAVKGYIILAIHQHRHVFNRNDKVKQIISIKESPPVFEMTCGVIEPKFTK